jgi:pimeloyl-ACP methyl ester carboxylesterase
MRWLFFACLAPGLLVGLCLAGLPQARSADDKKKVEPFISADGVKLEGTFYQPQGPKAGKDSPCVLLLHKIGGTSADDGWDSLAKDLQKEGYAVLAFDFRGHGDSKTINPATFWGIDPANPLPLLSPLRDQCKFNRDSYRPGLNPAKLKDSISIQDFNKSYYPALANDIARAKLFLDEQNDAGVCNSRNLILIGAEDGATLAAMWLYGEMNLYEVSRGGIRAQDPEGTAVTAAVFLSISPYLGSRSTPLSTWIRYLGHDKKLPMAFVYGEKEKNAETSRLCFSKVKPPTDTKTVTTGEKPIKDSQLSGSALLGDKLETRDWIINKYLKFIQKELKVQGNKPRQVKESMYSWVFPGNALPLPAKSEKDETMYPFPFERVLNH